MTAFDSFVVFAEMRTGSNFLEATLNRLPDVTCHGELFNPHFVGYPNDEAPFGFDHARRDADPMGLVGAVRGAPGLNGFRYFHDHHAAVLDPVLRDPAIGKVILTRNPLESYVSWKIAQATGQWKLTNATHHKAVAAEFDGPEFEAHVEALQAFQVRLLNALQRSGQTAFYVAYEDIQDLEAMNGLAAWLGSGHRLDGLDRKLKKQNPAPMSEKVADYDAMEAALARIDRFDLGRTPNFEPRRGPAVPSYVAAAEAPLLFMPIQSGPSARVRAWLSALGDGPLQEDFTQKALRQWRRRHKDHRSFTVLRHPVARAYQAFCDRIVGTGPGAFLEVRKTLMRVHNVPLASEGPDAGWGAAEQRAAFAAFLAFLKQNLGGQTAIRVDPAWASQTAILQGFGEFQTPDMVAREERLEDDLGHLCAAVGQAMTAPPAAEPPPIPLAEIYDGAIEDAAKEAYQRDYIQFGYRPWHRY
ncbi:MAG: nodulation protein NodH [Shimia sp.]